MTRAVGPRVGMPDQARLPLALIAACWIPVGAAALVWVAGHVASALTGHGWAGPALSAEWGFGLVSKGPGPSWPGVPVALVWALSALLGAVVVAPPAILAVRWRGRRAAPGDPLGSMAGARDVAPLCPEQAAAKARELRPSLAGVPVKSLEPRDIGLPVGVLKPDGPALRASFEDVGLIFMAPRRGKTSEFAIPQTLDAPAALVATSNKADFWALTADIRARETGERVWVFDPHQIAHAPQSWWWNPLRGVTTVQAAQRLSTHFVTEVRGDSQREFWSSAAQDILASMFLAAGCSGGTLMDVYAWLNEPTSPVPVDLLEGHEHLASAQGLAGKQAGAPETREGEFETARTAAQCLRDPEILAWVTPSPHGRDEFDPANFAATRQSLYLLSKEDAGGAAPLVAAFADRVMHDAERLAERRGGRLDPPLVVVLDEAANICKIANLPQLYSHFGSRGIVVMTILQSWAQGVRVWGETGMDALWSAATIKVVGSGMDDDRFLERVSRLVGEHDVPIRAVSQGGGGVGENVSLRRQRILPVEELRALPKSTAVLIASGCRAALVALQPWYQGPRKAEIAAAGARAIEGLTERANRAVPRVTIP